VTEVSLLRNLARRLPAIGDDCAIVPHGREDLLLKVDMLIEHVHFRREQRSASDVGYRALARALSDIAAMGGRPRWALVGLALPPWATRRWVNGFYDGLLKLAASYGVEVVGGDLSHADQLVADVFLAGVAPRGRALRRSTAGAGDVLYVSGPLGHREWRFAPRLELGESLRRDRRVTACMDLSDGIALDLHRMMFASGVEARLDDLPVAKGADLSRALHYGEDYELLFARRGAWRNPPPGVVAIGAVHSTRQPGRVTLSGAVVPPVGYDHLKQA
jgi:thiamine-monophosphate kinase